MNIKKLITKAGGFAQRIAKREAAKAKKKAAAALKREAKRQAQSVKRQALDMIGIKSKKATKKGGTK